jgi:hypothetical protein
MSNQEALNDLIQRFAISALSRERQHEALNEEILVGKYTGEFYIKTKDGVVMSADVMNRRKLATNEAIRIAELMGMTGSIYNVELEKQALPNHVDYNVNILQNDGIVLPADTKEVLLNLDIDEYDVIDNKPNIVHSETGVKVLFEIVNNGQTTYKRVDKTLANINFALIDFKEYEKITSIKIQEIVIQNSENNNRVLLLHNLFVTVNN